MRITSHMKYWLAILVIGLWGVNNAGKSIRQAEHIEYLEVYIQENDLPTPAFLIKDGPVGFEIDVPVC